MVTAEGSFRADVAVDGETIDGGRRRPPARRRGGRRRLRRAADAGLHRRPHAHGHAVRRHGDRRRLGHRARPPRVAGGTTTLVDFSLQDVEGTLDRRRRDLAGQGGASARIDYGLHVAITNLTEDVKRELPSLPALGVATIKIFMAYKGTPLYTEDDDLFEAMQIARECGAARARPRRERRRDRQAAGAGARARRHRAALPRADAARRPSRPRRPTARSGSPRSPTRRCSSSTSPAPRRSRRSGARTRAAARSTPRPARSTSCSPTPTSRSPASRARSTCCSPPLRDPSNQAGAVARACRRQDLHIFGSDHCSFNFARPEGAGPRRLHADPERRARASRSARRCCGRTASARAGSART